MNLRNWTWITLKRSRQGLKEMAKKNKLKQVGQSVDKFRNDLGKKTGVTASSAEIIRNDRVQDH